MSHRYLTRLVGLNGDARVRSDQIHEASDWLCGDDAMPDYEKKVKVLSYGYRGPLSCYLD